MEGLRQGCGSAPPGAALRARSGLLSVKKTSVFSSAPGIQQPPGRQCRGGPSETFADFSRPFPAAIVARQKEVFKLRRLLAVAGLVCAVSAPGFANTVTSHDAGARKSAAVAGAYLSIDLGGKGAKPRGGLRLQMQHDYRDGTAPRAPVHTSDTAEIRLVGPAQPTLYLGGRAVTGEEARKQQALSPVGTAVTLAVVAGVVVGGLLLLSAVRDSGGE